MTFEVLLDNKPILILQLRNPGDLHFVSTRELADFQVRQRLVDLCGSYFSFLSLYGQLLITMDLKLADCPLPTLYAISAMGTALCFYSLKTKKQDAEIAPMNILRHPTRMSDVAPKDRWDLDILTAEGENKLRAVVEEIKQASKSLGDSSMV
jgi:hypothetical protein